MKSTKQPQKTTIPSQKPKSDSGDKKGGAVNILQFATSSVDAYRSYADMKKEEEITKRVIIEGQKDIILGEQSLEKARMEHSQRIVELSNLDTDSQHKHEQIMTDLELRGEENRGRREERKRILDKLSEGKITGEIAAEMLTNLLPEQHRE